MWIAIIVFAGLGLWFLPLAAVVSYDGGWRLLWLPRVWCGYAAARPLPARKEARRGRSLLRRLPPGFSAQLLRQLLIRLGLLRFRFCLAPEGSRLYCIAGITVGNIIISIARAALIYSRRRKRRGQWPLNMRSRN
ncbi:MAG: hypothetical protein J6T26_09000 [Firmicutes bacterium]|nr:hypothetical protein [Bacillota bacterium]